MRREEVLPVAGLNFRKECGLIKNKNLVSHLSVLCLVSETKW